MILRLLKKYPAFHLWLALSLMVYAAATLAVTDAVKHFEIITFSQQELFEADTTLFVALPTIVFLLTTYLYFELMVWSEQLHTMPTLGGLVFFFLSALGSFLGFIQFKLFNLHFYLSALVYIRAQDFISDKANLFIFSEIIVNVVFMTLFLIGMILMRYFFTWHHETLQRWHHQHMHIARR